MVEKKLQEMSDWVETRGIYWVARTIVILLFGGILFFPQELKLALEMPIFIGLMLFGTIVMAVILLSDLLLTGQKSISSLMYKYMFLTLSVILAYGLFYYINSTILDPPGMEYWKASSEELERAVFYFSGVTYFTIGYGDFVPVGANAQTAAVSEALVGNVISLIVLATAFQRWAWKSQNKQGEKIRK